MASQTQDHQDTSKKKPQWLCIQNPIILGASFAVMQSLLFSLMGMFVKLANETGHHPVDMMFFRSFVCMVIALAFLWQQGSLHKIFEANYKNQLIRGIVGTSGMILTFTAFSYLPLSEVQSILFAAPIFVVMLSYPLLKEPVGLYRAGAACIGFLGVLLIVQPSSISNFTGGLIAIGAAVFHALIMIILRWIGRSEAPMITVFYFALISTVIVLPALPFYFTWPSLYELFLLVMVGAIAFFLQVCLTKSYTYTDASLIAPITYLNLIWSLVLDLYIWGFVPSIATLIGATIIMTSSFTIIYRESRKKQKCVQNVEDLS